MAVLISRARAALSPRRLRDRWRILRDLAGFRRAYGSLLGVPLASDPDRRVLLVGLHGFIPSAKEEGVYAKALQWRGYTPYVVVSRRRRSLVVPYYRLFGFERLVEFDEFVAVIPRDPLMRRAREIIAGTRKATDLVGLTYRDVHVGRHVLSLLMRQLHASRLDLRDEQVAARLTELLADAMQSVHAAEALLDEVRPEVLLFNERGYTPFGEVFDVALNRGLNVIQFCASHRDDARIFKRYTRQAHAVHPHSLSEESWTTIRSMVWHESHERALAEELYGHYAAGTWFNFQRLQHGKQIKSKAEVQAQLGLDPAKKTAVIFAHILWDATFFYGESLFEDYEEWLVETVRAACANPAVNWIVKLHPVNVWRLEADRYTGELAERVVLRNRIGRLPDHVKLVDPDNDINTYSLFETADYGLTVRGTVGIEMAMFGIPVLTAGTGRYSGLGFTIDLEEAPHYREAVRRIQEYPPLTAEQTVLARKYAYGIFKLRPLRLTTVQMVFSNAKDVFHPLNGSLVIKAESLRELAEAEDMSAFAEWAIDARQLDYLAPVEAASHTLA